MKVKRLHNPKKKIKSQEYMKTIMINFLNVAKITSTATIKSIDEKERKNQITLEEAMSKRKGGIKVSQKSKFKVNKSCPSISLLLLFAVIRLCLQIFHVSAFIVYNSLSCTLPMVSRPIVDCYG